MQLVSYLDYRVGEIPEYRIPSMLTPHVLEVIVYAPFLDKIYEILLQGL